jgi:membrane-associated phospholipid phosphatase
MHSLVDVIGGLAIGLVILPFWLIVNQNVDIFIVSGQNGMYTSVATLMVTNLYS